MANSIALFTATLLLTVWLLLRIARRASPARYHAVSLLLLVWISVTGALAYSQALTNFNRIPPILPVCILFAIAASTALALKMPTEISISLLIGFQAFRVPVEIFLYLGYQAGYVPVQMTWEGRNWDVLTGLTALPVAWLASRDKLPIWAVHLWNAAGFALLLNIMTIAILSLPTPFRQFHNDPANLFVTQLPFVWLPAILVPAAWFGHLALFKKTVSKHN